MRQIAIAVRDADLFLVATVVRAAASDVYVNWPRDHVVGWKPHTSYHASGQHHQKSFGKKLLVKKAQKPNAAFKGAANLVSFGLASDDHKALNIQCDPADFSDVFEIPVALLDPDKYRTYAEVDLVDPSIDLSGIPGGAVRLQKSYKDAEPWIVLTLRGS